MKLTDLVVQEAAPLGDDPVELKDVVEFFPSQYKKAIKAFAKKGRLRFGGDELFTSDGEHGPALDDAIRVAQRFLKHEPINVEVEFNTAGTDLPEPSDRSFEIECDVEESTPVWVGYDTKQDMLLLGFDVWIGDNEFNDEWDNKFEDAFGEGFDQDNEDHDKVFDKAWKTFSNGQMFYGAIVQVNAGGHAEMEMPIMDGGFYRGPFKHLSKTNVIELNG